MDISRGREQHCAVRLETPGPDSHNGFEFTS